MILLVRLVQLAHNDLVETYLGTVFENQSG